MADFGHIAHSEGSTFLDTWGAGPFYIRVDGKRYRFEDSDMFGPAILTKSGEIAVRQPGEKHPFWRGYHMWRWNGRKLKCKVMCVWREPKPGTYWKDSRGISHFLSDPEWEPLGYVQVSSPHQTGEAAE